MEYADAPKAELEERDQIHALFANKAKSIRGRDARHSRREDEWQRPR